MGNKPAINIPEISTEQAIEMLVEDMLCSFHTNGDDTAKDKKVEDAYFKYSGIPFFSKTPTPSYFRGFPGQGKTTAFKVASREVAELMGLEYIENPDNEFTINKNHLLFVSLELSGEVSAVTIGGIPKSVAFKNDRGEEKEYMAKLVEKRMAMLADAGASVFLLDDFANAAPSVQNVALSITEEKRFQGMSIGKAYCGLTGNLGLLDGTNVSNTSTANATRVKSYIVSDDLDAWLGRTATKYNDDIGDAGIMGFMRRNTELFHKPTGSKNGEPYPCSRSWSKFLNDLRASVHKYRFLESQGGDIARLAHKIPLGDIVLSANGTVGIEAGRKLESYYTQLLQHGADSIARQVIDEGEFNNASKEKISQKLGNAVSSDELGFGTALVQAVAEYAADNMYRALKNDDPVRLEKAAKGLTNGLFGFVEIDENGARATTVDNSQINEGLTHFAMRFGMLAKDNPDWASVNGKNGVYWPTMEVIDKIPMCEHPTAMVKVGEKNGVPVTRYEAAFVDVISQKNRYDDNFTPAINFTV